MNPKILTKRPWLRRFPILVYLLIICMAICAGCGFSSAGTLETGFYKDVIMLPNGQFIAKGKLSNKEAAEAGRAFKVEMDEKKKDQVKQIIAIHNKTPRMTTWTSLEGLWDARFAIVKVTPQEKGFLKYAFYDSHGNPCAGFFNALSVRYRMDEKKKTAVSAYLYNSQDQMKQNSTMGILTKTHVEQLLFAYDKESRLAKISAANHDGVITKYKGFGADNATTVQLSYDPKTKNQIQSIAWTNENGNPVKGWDWSKMVFTRDGKGCVTERKFLDVTGTPIELKNSNWLEIPYMALTNEHPHINKIQQFLDNFKYVTQKLNMGSVTKFAYKKDELWPSKISFFGNKGQHFSPGGVGEYELTYDKSGNIIKVTSLGSDGRVTNFVDKITSIAFIYDERGNITQEIFYRGRSRYPLQLGYFKGCNVSEIHYTYDEFNRVTSESYFDNTVKPTGLKQYGGSPFNPKRFGPGTAYHKVVFSYLGNGKLRKSYFAADGTAL